MADPPTPKPEKASPLIAVFALVALGGILAVPITFILYGAGGVLGGLMFLGVLIACQAFVFIIAKLLVGGVAAVAIPARLLISRRRK